MFLGHLFEFQKRFCHHTRTNFLKFKVWSKRDRPKKFGRARFDLTFQKVSSGVMTAIVLKTCISFKKFQKPRQVFQTLFRKPETKQHMASQLTELSFEAELSNFTNS